MTDAVSTRLRHVVFERALYPGVRSVAVALMRHGMIALVVLGPVLAILTAYTLSEGAQSNYPPAFQQIVLLVDLCYILVLCAVVASRVGGLYAARRRRSAGTRLHIRLASVFAAVALMPTILVAIFATLTLGIGLENLFSNKIGSVVQNAMTTAEAYRQEHVQELGRDVQAMENELNRAARAGVSRAQLNDIIIRQTALRDVSRAYVFNLDREIIARGEFSYLFNFVAPTDDQIAAARAGETVIAADPDNDEIRALVALSATVDTFLYVSRAVQGNVLHLLDETRDTVQFYEALERQRGQVLIDYAIVYLGFALVVILTAILLGLWFAARLAKPVGRLVLATEHVGEGDLSVRVKEGHGDDEFTLLSRAFNRMTEQLEGQRSALLRTSDEIESRRRFIETVLSGVTAGVIGLDSSGRIEIVNDMAGEIIGRANGACLGMRLDDVVPEFGVFFDEMRARGRFASGGQVRLSSDAGAREVIVRMAPKSPGTAADGFVVTFDDVTELMSAQRQAAWGDVARRIAHEIKNPLTPIQLSADRLRRKVARNLPIEPEDTNRYLDVIMRQTDSIRRMVDEFARFARLPEPDLKPMNLAEAVDEAVLLQRAARRDIDYRVSADADAAILGDAGLIAQLLTNVLQNAADAIDGRVALGSQDGGWTPVISVHLEQAGESHSLTVLDNGKGFPSEERERLTEPYRTTREQGTGLGLAIVKKLVEQHGGQLRLGDAAGVDGLDGARVDMRFPALRAVPSGETVVADAMEK